MSALSSALMTVNLAVSVPLFGLGLFSCYWTTYAWHSPETFERSVRTGDPEVPPRFRFSVIVPVREESYHVMRATIRCLLDQTHPHVQAVLSVGHDDPETLAHARRLQHADRSGRLTVSISWSDVHNKPTQLNAALPECTGDIVGLLDAESLSAPGLLRRVDAVFQETGVSVVQGGVLLTNYRSSWVSMRSALEYYAHHRSKMHFSADRGAILMGGNTVFFRRDVLEEIGGWDAGNLTEDAEISIRLLAHGHRVTVAYDPDVVSREEAPVTARAWVKQRTRWNLGFLQTIGKGVWRELPTRQRRLTLWHLLQPTLMSFTGLALPLSVLSLVLCHPPIGVALLTCVPLVPTVVAAVVECVLLRMFARDHADRPARLRDLALLVATVPAYQVLLAAAALRAAVKYRRGEFTWDKTVHEGHHLTKDVLAEAAA